MFMLLVLGGESVNPRTLEGQRPPCVSGRLQDTSGDLVCHLLERDSNDKANNVPSSMFMLLVLGGESVHPSTLEGQRPPRVSGLLQDHFWRPRVAPARARPQRQGQQCTFVHFHQALWGEGEFCGWL